jgi:hypothetical protein
MARRADKPARRKKKRKRVIFFGLCLPALPVEGPEPNLEQGRQAERALIERIWQGVAVCNIFSLNR